MGNNNEKGEKAYSINRDEKHTLGEGAYGVVYRVKRKSDKKVCAAKIFKLKKVSMQKNSFALVITS